MSALVACILPNEPPSAEPVNERLPLGTAVPLIGILAVSAWWILVNLFLVLGPLAWAAAIALGLAVVAAMVAVIEREGR
ncbi:hypothetical protein [Roseomonas xinghualingensis]|uniref:hypothetical protein n=1 Tax=Roseomonas xinghualingensis TaxID=2986475 RepID=UPI0021F1A7F9|nr:hypothetical protein [Roseomonas sp. SXEYE001]MCV4210289.1 hypothetical protein [Roseomonas sp. SXEYE001]